MKAMYINAPGQVEFRDIDKPVRQKGEVLLKLLYGGICGSGFLQGDFRILLIIQGYQAMSFLRKSWRWDEDNGQGLRPGMIVICNPYFNCGTLLFL